jgi:hypothetical protein
MVSMIFPIKTGIITLENVTMLIPNRVPINKVFWLRR